MNGLELFGSLLFNQIAYVGNSPVQNIAVERVFFVDVGQIPFKFRDALAGMGCNGCLACIHACSQGAIALSSGEKNPTARWRNGHVSLRDLMVANSR